MTGGAALASGKLLRSLPPQHDPAQKVGYCIVGLGRVSINEFLPGLRFAPHARPVAIVSRDARIARIIAKQYGIAEKNIYSYANFASIADNPAIDAVYIALPNSMHAEYTVRAAQAGKHVLCEKPMATSVAEAQQMIAACRKASRKLMIAYRCHFEPVTQKARELVESRAMGTPQIYTGTFGFSISPSFELMGERRKEWRLVRAMAGGGPLMDVGIYCLNGIRYVSGEEPGAIDAVIGRQPQDPRFREVEENLSWTMRFPSGATASCSTTYASDTGERLKVCCSHATLTQEPAYSYASHRLHVEGGPNLDFTPHFPGPQQFGAEAEHFAQCILHNLQPLTPGEEGLRDMQIIARIYASAASGKISA